MKHIHFTPYYDLAVCSNRLYNVKYILSTNNRYPIIIAQNNFGYPSIWLYDVTCEKYIIYKNFAMHPSFRVQIDEDQKILSVEYTYSGATSWENVMSVNFSDPNMPNIFYMDLRPLGYNIYGNGFELHIGHSGIFRNAIYRNSDAFIGF